MARTNLPIPTGWKLLFRELYRRVHQQVTSPYTKVVFLAALFFVCTQKEISFNLSIAGHDLFSISQQSVFSHGIGGPVISGGAGKALFTSVARPSDKNWTKKQRTQLAYVEKFEAAALSEARKHGIPASITLAQGLLESGHGTSTLAKRNKNHFGIKCFSKQCRKGHCSNHSDDHHKDFFRVFEDAHGSYAAHSQVLLKNRYKPLFKLAKRDYKGWSHGLRKAGYATDPRYGDKLVALIETLELWRYDRVSA
ncbi:glycoside hydrolase family 73 protein [Neolewinella antarctica]|uniref:Mannosyl-glycoprotein endo-beta-N-acetylglucosamidase-like domain-containing protein n=1 Tax=Neolewinella antarctica TaxID=442734 RepID=A0ABX0XEI2_9BACT|nr:glucosaminidase domain-containing protein [Neolewinella antarctica]NJC27728.1 hypothetical protein [Neolewinella antarctica]